MHLTTPQEIHDGWTERERAALNMVVRAHAGQTYGEVPYIVHVIAVARRCKAYNHSERTVIVALLHDVLEDTYISEDTIGLNFGRDVRADVETLSRKTQSGADQRYAYDDYIAHLCAQGSEVAKWVKIADLEENLIACFASELCAPRPEMGARIVRYARALATLRAGQSV
jgi:(p)ppGpp synthase/HD superfamily hydrolase